MRARIIFRGLTLFTFKESSRGKSSNARPEHNKLGELTALLVTDPRHAHSPLHAHQPYLSFIGRDCEPPYAPRTETKRRIKEDLIIQLKNHDNVVPGIIPEGSFLDYVPCLRDLQVGGSPGINEAYVSCKIVIPHGRIRARDFITWDSWGNTPMPVAYMDTKFVGYAANEVVVEMGDDTDFDQAVMDKCLSIGPTDNGEKEYECLWPRVAAPNFTAADEDIERNVVEVVISNLPARRRRGVFWSKHFQTLFDAAGYPRRSHYTDAGQYDYLEAEAKDYDEHEWTQDADLDSLDGVEISRQPFPYLYFSSRGKLPELRPDHVPEVVRTPETHGRPKLEGIASPTAHTMGKTPVSQTNDPQNSQICPFGRE